MDWKVVAQGGSPSAASIDALTGLTGLNRDEVMLALSRGSLIAATGLSEDRAQELGDRLSRDPGIACRILPDSDERPSGPRFNVLLSGFAPGYRTRLRRKLQELTGLPPEQVVVWLSRVPFALSRNVDGETARRIRNQVTAAGGVVTVQAEKQPGPAASRPVVSAVFPSGDGSTSRGNPVPERTSSAAPTRQAVSSPAKSQGPPPDVESGDPPVIEPENGSRLSPPPGSSAASAESDLPRRSPPPVFVTGRPPTGASAPLPPKLKAITDIRSEAPYEFHFSPPSSRLSGTPGVVGGKPDERPVTGPSPEVVLLHAPSGAIPAWMLLPPLVGQSSDARGADVEDGEQGPPPVIRVILPEDVQPVQLAGDLHGLHPLPEAAPPEPAAFPLLPVEEGPPPSDGIFSEPDRAPRPVPVDATRAVPEAPPVITAPAPLQPVQPVSPAGAADEGTVPVRTVRRKVRRRSGVMQAPGTAPSAGRETPPRLAAFNLYVCSPSTGSRDRVESALVDVLGIPRGTVTDMLERCPAWLAGFRSNEKAAEVQGLLERKGVTVARTRDLLFTPDRGRNSSAKGFHTWLAADE